MAEGEVGQLKEALCNQYMIMKKLYMDLEEERDASATAASEALSMILRLQREKAAEKMEASQYKRMAEEKICHAEESLTVLEEVMQQKELEISLLRNQLQLYKHKLSNIGVTVLDIGDERVYGEKYSSDTSDRHSLSVRRNSLPSLHFDKFFRDMDGMDENGSLPQSMQKKLDEYANQLTEKCSEKEIGDQIKKESAIEDTAKLAQAKSSSTIHPVSSGQESSSSCSWYSALSHEVLHDSIVGMKASGEAESNENSVHSTFVHDIFEVSENCDCRNKIDVHRKDAKGSNFKSEVTDDQRLNKALMTRHNRSDISESEKWKHLLQEFKLCSPIKGAFSENNRSSTSQANLEQIKKQMKQLEDEKSTRKDDSEKSKEQLKLLKEICEQLNMLESHIKRSNSQKFLPQDDPTVVSIMEAVLSFSI
ncbi:myosin-binding protein 3 [Ananas comosus]|uniref:Myosin-binding protein 3 n=1 Tax=Ananas comosus TaxID=4615 RepID=A0A6P5EI81_ANACO|nr:myosin-binding protein 3 [Ananas comosus]